MNLFDDFCIFLNLFQVGTIITRKQIMENIPELSNETQGGWITTIDNYRNWFCKAGYLKWIKNGQYELIRSIPSDLTSVHLRKEAYPVVDPSDDNLLKWYQKGFYDELHGTSSLISNYDIENKAYRIGALHATVGDDVRLFDDLEDYEILKQIRK